MHQTFTHRGYTSNVWSCAQPVRIAGVMPHVYLRSYGRVTCDGHFRLEQVHSLVACHVFEKGAGVFELDGRGFEVNPGDMVVVRPGVHARYFDRPDRPWRYRWFTLDGVRSVRLTVEAGLKEDVALFTGSWCDRLAGLFSRIEAGFQSDPVSPFLPVALGWEILANVAEECRVDGRGSGDTLSGRAQFIMQQDFHRGLQVEDLARRLGVSRATLFRKFREEVGRSPKVYLDELRLDQARALLQRSHSTVKEVSHACGFRCPHYFSRAYRARYGHTPSSARRG